MSDTRETSNEWLRFAANAFIATTGRPPPTTDSARSLRAGVLGLSVVSAITLVQLLIHDHLVVDVSFLHQVVMGALFDKTSKLEYVDPIAILDRGEAMGDRDCGSAFLSLKGRK